MILFHANQSVVVVNKSRGNVMLVTSSKQATACHEDFQVKKHTQTVHEFHDLNMDFVV